MHGTLRRECVVFRPSFRSLIVLLAAVGRASCADAPSASPPRPVVRGRSLGRIAFQPVFSAAAQAAAARLSDFGINFDHVRVVIVRPPADTVADTTVAFAPGHPDLTLDLTVAVHSD